MREEKLMSVIVAPIVSEKSTRLAESGEQFVLQVLKNATKKEIKAAVELLFDVKVQTVNTIQRAGKSKRFGRNIGRRQDTKKAYITLVPGQNLDMEAATTSTAAGKE